jgi:lysine 2,3-aminomutase
MRFEERMFPVRWRGGAEDSATVSLETLGRRSVDFLEYFADSPLATPDFREILGPGNGETRFDRMIAAAGYPDDPAGFFGELLGRLERADGGDADDLAMGPVRFPTALLVALLEEMIPGSRFVAVSDVDKLERLTNLRVPAEDREAMQRVIERYPVRFSRHTIRQMRVSRNVAYQYMPFVEELDPVGMTNTWIGQFHQGLLEQMYRNRVIFVLNMSCPVYCRFCFRKHKDCRTQPDPSRADVERAVAYIAGSPEVKEMVLTGGDPFMNRETLTAAVDGLLEVPHVKTLRLATRSVAYYPHLFCGEEGNWRNFLKRKRLEAALRGKRIELATHFIHPDELSPRSLEIISDLAGEGIPVYIQTPFLNDCNDQGPELTRLFSALRGAGAEMHYIYIPCSPIQGNRVYWSPISKGLAAAVQLRRRLTDRAMPRICTATPIGKLDWFTSGWAVEPDPDDENFFWVRSPYTPEYFAGFAPGAGDQPVVRPNAEGTLDVRYMAKIGDPALFLGPRPVRPPREAPTPDPSVLSELWARLVSDSSERASIVPTDRDGVRRLHRTRVAVEPEALDAALDYIREDSAITDVVVAGRRDALVRSDDAARLVAGLRDIPHVNAVRLRSPAFVDDPEAYTLGAVDRLAAMNRLSAARPLRLEIETCIFRPEQIGAAQETLADALRERGITVYATTPLLSGINDHPDAIHEIAYNCRNAGIEFHHVVVAGTPIQAEWNRENPVDTADVIDIATRVRRNGSGREIPRYIVQTPLGEVDFGLTSRMAMKDGALWIGLLPYDLAYFEAMAADFHWPADARVDGAGTPWIPAPGLISSDGFMMVAEAF